MFLFAVIEAPDESYVALESPRRILAALMNAL
jgi:hypothetical protein